MQKNLAKCKIIKKEKKYYNIDYHYILILKKSINNSILIILLKLKKFKVLQIVIIFSNCIIYTAIK